MAPNASPIPHHNTFFSLCAPLPDAPALDFAFRRQSNLTTPMLALTNARVARPQVVSTRSVVQPRSRHVARSNVKPTMQAGRKEVAVGRSVCLCSVESAPVLASCWCANACQLNKHLP